jgi:hypothetical protein
MQEQEGKHTKICRNMHGMACYCCGSRRYQLVLRSVKKTEIGHLVARCIQCHHSREIDDYLARVLWM